MQPTPGDVHIDRALTNVSIAYLQNPQKFVADKVFPRIPVTFKSDKIAKFDKQPWMRSQAKARALSTESAGGGYTVTTDSYAAEVYAIHKDIDDQVRANADAPFAPDRNATNWVTGQLLLQREIQFMSKFFVTGLWTTEWSGVASDSPNAALYQFERWDRAGSTPIADVIGRCTAVEKLCGERPNVGVIQRSVFDALKTNSDIVSRVQYTSRDSIDLEILARLFELDELVLASAVYDSAEEGAAASQDFVAGKHMLLAFRQSEPALDAISAGYIPVWTGYLGAGAYGNRIKKFRMEHLNSDRVEGELAYDMKVVCADAAAFMLSAVS